MKIVCTLLSLFLGFCLSAFAGAQAGTTLLVKTDMNCNWKLDARPMGLLNADDSIVILVSPGERLIEATTTDGIATIRAKVEVDKVEKTVVIQLKRQYDQQLKMQRPKTPSEQAGDPLDPTWTDRATGLIWTKKDNGSDVNWQQASSYCSNLQLAGYSGWRLPTIEELQAIYDPSISFQVKFDNGVTYNVHVKGNLKLTGWHWSNSQGNRSSEAWQFVFGIEEPRHSLPRGFNYSSRALCVRGPEHDGIDR